MDPTGSGFTTLHMIISKVLTADFSKAVRHTRAIYNSICLHPSCLFYTGTGFVQYSISVFYRISMEIQCSS